MARTSAPESPTRAVRTAAAQPIAPTSALRHAPTTAWLTARDTHTASTAIGAANTRGATSLATAQEEKMRLGAYVLTARMPETDRLWATICTWWPHIEVAIITGVTNARTEAANTGIKHIKRTGRGFRNESHYLSLIHI